MKRIVGIAVSLGSLTLLSVLAIWQFGLGDALAKTWTAWNEVESATPLNNVFMVELHMQETGSKYSVISRDKGFGLCQMERGPVDGKDGIFCRIKLEGYNPKLRRIRMMEPNKGKLLPVPYALALYIGQQVQSEGRFVMRLEMPDPWAPTSKTVRPVLRGHGAEYHYTKDQLLKGVGLDFVAVGYHFNPRYSGMRVMGRPGKGVVTLKLHPVTEQQLARYSQQ